MGCYIINKIRGVLNIKRISTKSSTKLVTSITKQNIWRISQRYWASKD